MGKFKEENGHSRLTGALRDLGDVGKPLLKIIGNVVPNARILADLADNIRTSKDIKEEKKQELMILLKLASEDVDSARENQTDIQQSQFASWMAKNVAFIIDLYIALIWGVMTVFIVAKTFKLIQNDLDITPVLGIYTGVTGLFVQIVTFHRGSSVGSRIKDVFKK